MRHFLSPVFLSLVPGLSLVLEVWFCNISKMSKSMIKAGLVWFLYI